MINTQGRWVTNTRGSDWMQCVVPFCIDARRKEGINSVRLGHVLSCIHVSLGVVSIWDGMDVRRGSYKGSSIRQN